MVLQGILLEQEEEGRRRDWGANSSLNTILTFSGKIHQTVLPPEIVFSSPSPSTATARFRLDNSIPRQG